MAQFAPDNEALSPNISRHTALRPLCALTIGAAPRRKCAASVVSRAERSVWWIDPAHSGMEFVVARKMRCSKGARATSVP
jgi:hypothetical protein